MQRPDTVTVQDLDRILQLVEDLKRLYPAAVEASETVSMSSGGEGPGRRTGSHSDPTATAALDGRRKRRRDGVRKSRKAISAALRQMQEALFYAVATTQE